MKIIHLTTSNLPEVIKGVGPELNQAGIDELELALNVAAFHGTRLYVRYAPGWLQRLEVDPKLLDSTSLKAQLMSDKFWEKHS